MAAYHSSPVLVQHASSPHSMSSPLALNSLSPFPLESQSEPVRLPEPIVPSNSAPSSSDLQTPLLSLPEILMSDGPGTQQEASVFQVAENPNWGERSHVQPQPATQVTQEGLEEADVRQEQHVNDNQTDVIRQPHVGDGPSTSEVNPDRTQDVQQNPPSRSGPDSAEQAVADPSADPVTSPSIPEMPGQDALVPTATVPDEPPPPPEWATWEDDLSTPSEEEWKRIKERGETHALDTAAIGKHLLSFNDDPDIRPVKKLRMNWVIRNIRGNKTKPNHARVMISPPFKVDGRYWQIKFFPRGNDEHGQRDAKHLSLYLRCGWEPLASNNGITQSTCTFYQGSPDSDFGEGATPEQVIDISPPTEEASGGPEAQAPPLAQDQPIPASSDTPPTSQAEANAGADGTSMQDRPSQVDWRTAAAMGVTMYNPQEPRTFETVWSTHQFNPQNEDWGFLRFGSRKWKYLHIRGGEQRTPFIQKDTLAIDVNVLIFDDPSQSLWWHPSDTEPSWNSKLLAGYYPMGTPHFYYSPAVAGLTALLLLVPFRKLIQSIDGGAWRSNSQLRPRPLVCKLQMVLSLMRHLLPTSDNYVNVVPIIDMLQAAGETFLEVNTFWDALRRSLELELEGESAALTSLSKIFDTANGPVSFPPLPVETVANIQQGVEHILDQQNFQGLLPDFLPLTLDRQKFDKRTRKWVLLQDHVHLNEEIDLSRFSTDGAASKYTLYGFVVHSNERTSEKFFSVLRPGGPQTKWLEFSDGNGNKVKSYTTKGLQKYWGLEGQALKDYLSQEPTPPLDTVYLAMYVRSDLLGEYLAPYMEPYLLPEWMVQHLQSGILSEGIISSEHIDGDTNEIQVEVYSDQAVIGRTGLLDPIKMTRQSQHLGTFHKMTFSSKFKFQDVRSAIATKLSIDNSERIRLFVLNFGSLGDAPEMFPVILSTTLGDEHARSRPLCLWMSILHTAEDLEAFGEPDHKEVDDQDARWRMDTDETNRSTDHDGWGDSTAAADLEQESVQQAVLADVQRLPSTAEAQVGPAPSIENNQGTAMPTGEIVVSGVEDETALEVPHGHLVDATSHEQIDSSDTVEMNGNGATNLIPVEDAAITTSVDGATVTMEMLLSTVQNGNEPDSMNTANSESSSALSSPEEQARPVACTYVFLQFFDVENQTFRLIEAFFTKADDKVKDALRRKMGYPLDKQFEVWRRAETPVKCEVVADDECFEANSVTTYIIGDKKSEMDDQKLQRQGKYWDPFEVGDYLRMLERKHPIRSKTTAAPIVQSVFGEDYYQGHLVQGQRHGEKCVLISGEGNMYEGPMALNEKWGQGGKMTYCNGDTYEGEWEEDERHGQGTMIESRTGNKYVGGFEHGKRWGTGTTYWQVADEQADLCQICAGEEVNALFYPCGHVCACVECAGQCPQCPICRKSVQQVVKMFRA
ncbi:hypothetical protein PV10_08151 [Exophiala mesophila]|uniref:RING-type domain-containing protein n=1 Tax=Exophiala mesophila TaxID=212818 RepID=A0A0D1ZNY4_EXOME|nr:uncharacterized protein PV10_08151 [Exophiala mesophila]KIV88468.1 hypothetical protein PV10_08151 [Exophiala mesophila]